MLVFTAGILKAGQLKTFQSCILVSTKLQQGLQSLQNYTESVELQRMIFAIEVCCILLKECKGFLHYYNELKMH